MKIYALSAEEFRRHRTRLVRFLRQHGERRITKDALRWLEREPIHLCDEEGGGIWVVVDGNRLVGMAALSDYGRRESVIAVHRDYRQKGVAQELIATMRERLGKLYGRIALDNFPSLKMSFAAGFVAFDLIEGPTGKPTFWVGLGDWKREDVT